MFRITLKNNHNDNVYIYRWAIDCFGKSLELGLSYAELDSIRRRLRLSRRPVKKYIESVRTRISEKRLSQQRAKAKRTVDEREAAA